jgi:hypothetical protein
MSVLLVLAAPMADYVCNSAAECANQGVGNFVGTPARIWASIAAFVALVSVVGGWRALRSARAGRSSRTGATVALVAGLTGVVNGVVNLAVADGGLGTGNGVAGGAIALVLGLVGAVLGGVAALRRSAAQAVNTG